VNWRSNRFDFLDATDELEILRETIDYLLRCSKGDLIESPGEGFNEFELKYLTISGFTEYL
jgi:hypothetical protein